MTFVNLNKFNEELTKASKDLVNIHWRRFYQKLGLDLLRGVVLKTPVGNPDAWIDPKTNQRRRAPSGYVGGRARANWQVAINAGTNENEIEAVDGTGGATVQRGSTALLQLESDPFASIHVFNNVPYIVRLEEGWSGQAPTGMIAVTLAEIQSSVAGD